MKPPFLYPGPQYPGDTSLLTAHDWQVIGVTSWLSSNYFQTLFLDAVVGLVQLWAIAHLLGVCLPMLSGVWRWYHKKRLREVRRKQRAARSMQRELDREMLADSEPVAIPWGWERIEPEPLP